MSGERPECTCRLRLVNEDGCPVHDQLDTLLGVPPHLEDDDTADDTD
jgi:hypothetical protein